MSPQDRRPTRRSDDPDATAELPALADPGLADPDTWVAPLPVRGTLVDEVLQAHETEIQLLRRELAHSSRERAAYERQYLDAIGDREEMRQQLSAAEARADDLARQLNDFERSVEERDVRIGELQLDLDDAANLPAAAAAAAASAAATAAQGVATVASGQGREDDAQLRGLREQLEQLRWRAAAQSEALQSREVRRQLNESQWRELEAAVDERDGRIRALEHELAAARVLAERPAGMPTATPGGVPLEAEPWPPAAAGPEGGAPADREAPSDPDGGQAEASVPAADPRAADTGAFAATGDFAASGEFTAGQGAKRPVDDAPVRMLVRTDGDAGIVHVLGRRTTVGRTPDNDLRINAEWISRHHAVVLLTSSGTVLEDLNSTNGVLVNGLRVARRQLDAGDIVTFGKSAFRYLVKSAGSEAGS